MFVALLAAGSWLQVFQASSLNADGRNSRTIYREYGRDRGPIVIAGQAVASSAEVEDSFTYQRSYADGPLYAFVTGYYPVFGRATGTELGSNDVLNGTAPSLFLQRIQDLFTGSQPKGGSVELTINPKAQQAAVDALGDQTGAAVALDPKTGAILAMVSTPGFDPNALATHDQAAFNATYKSLSEDPSKPLVNRAIAGDTYPPGSVFKLVVAATALESGNYTPDSLLDSPTTLTLPGTTTTMQNPGGEVCADGVHSTLANALRVSCNTPMANLGMSLGAPTIADQAEKFGFGHTFTISDPTQTFDVGQKPLNSQFVTPSYFPADANAPQTAMSSIGQFDVRVTPMQIAMVSAAIANDGKEMTPYLVQTTRDSALNVVSTTEPVVFSNPISSTTAQQLTDMMVGVVDNGTGFRAQISGVQVAGKTGTAQTGTGSAPHAWFTGFAPANDPQVVVAVVVEQGGSLGDEATGAKVSAPIAKKIMEAVLNG